MSIIEAEMQPAAKVAQMGFDYSQVDEGVRDEVRDAAKGIRAYGQAFRGSVIAIGKRLIEVKGMLPHGQFGEWLDAEFGMSDRTARNFMNVAQRYEFKTEILPFLNDTVLYLLASPSTSDEVRTEIEQRALDGERVKVADVQAAKAAAKFAEPKPVAPREVKRLRDETRKPEVTPAKEVYVEPTPFPSKEEFAAIEGAVEASITPEAAEKMRQSAEAARRVREDLDFVDPEEAAAIAEVAAEREQEEAERIEKNRSMGILSHGWIVGELIKDDPAHPYFKNALRAADADDVREALASISTEDKFCDARLAALKGRMEELEPTPESAVTATVESDARREDAQALFDLLTAARDTARAHYGELTGRSAGHAVFERGVATMLGHLADLLNTFEGSAE